jgi:hypothetical protein
MAAAMDVDDDMGESSGLGTDKAGKKRFEVKKVTFPNINFAITAIS